MTGDLCLNLQVLNDLQVLRVPMRLEPLLLFFHLPLLDVTPQHAHLLVQVLPEVELMQLCQSQLAIVIIEALLGDAEHLGRLLQVDLLFIVIGLGTILMQISPFLDQTNRLAHRPLSTSHVFLLLTVHIITGRSRVVHRRVLAAVADENHRWFQQILMEDAAI